MTGPKSLFGFNIGGAIYREHGSVPGVLDGERLGMKAGTDIFGPLQDFAAALAQGTGASNPTVLLPWTPLGEDMTLSNQVVFDVRSHFGLVGRGENATRIQWAGPGGVSMLRLETARAPHLEGFFLQGLAGAQKPLAGIQIHHKGFAGTNGGAPMRGVLRRVRIGGFVSNLFDYNVLFSCAAGQDTNNEQWLIEHCLLQFASLDGIWVAHQNSLWHRIIGGAIENFGRSAVNWADVWQEGGVDVAPFGGGGLTILGVTTNGNIAATALFRGGRSQHATTISGGFGEGSSQLLVMPYNRGGSAHAGVLISGGSYKLGGTHTHHVDIAEGGMPVAMRDAYVLSSNGVGFRTTGAGSYLALDNISGNPARFAETGGGRIDLGRMRNADSPAATLTASGRVFTGGPGAVQLLGIVSNALTFGPGTRYYLGEAGTVATINAAQLPGRQIHVTLLGGDVTFAGASFLGSRTVPSGRTVTLTQMDAPSTFRWAISG